MAGMKLPSNFAIVISQFFNHGKSWMLKTVPSRDISNPSGEVIFSIRFHIIMFINVHPFLQKNNVR
jgi:hypothetical protein